MHIQNGNVVADNSHSAQNDHSYSWKRQHKRRTNYSLTIGTLNVGGLSNIVKRKQTCDLSLDVCCITESLWTHDLHRRTSEVFTSYHCVFTPDQHDRQFSGVSLLLRKTAFWQITPLNWNRDDACYQYCQDCRLVAAQAWLGHGGTSILFYVVYGPSGSRWENHKRTYLNEMLDAITEDVVSRGQLPTVLLGDLNMLVAESSKLQTLIRSRTWNNACALASPEFVHTPTCHTGKRQGSQIDLILTSASLYDQLFQNEVVKFDSSKDHSLVSVRLNVPAPIQTRWSLRAPATLPDLALPTASDSHIACQIDSHFHTAVTNKNVDAAYKSLMQEINRVLFSVADRQHIKIQNHRAHRGSITSHEQRRHPKSVGTQASTLLTRQLRSASNRAIEVSKATDGYRRTRTWLSLRNILRYLPADQYSEVLAISDSPASHESALKIAETFKNLLEAEEKQNRYHRTNSWKRNMRSDTSHSFKWLKNKSKHVPVAVTVTVQGTTANTHARLDSISQVWIKIYQQHKNGEPSMHSFLQKYGANMRRANINLQNITASDVSKAVAAVRPSAAGMDRLLPCELKVICLWCPEIITHMADLYNIIESTGHWPQELTKGAVSFLPKSNETCPSADNFRPLTILSSLYRLWAKFRHDQLCDSWLPLWKSRFAYGLKDSHAADALAFETCLEISETMQQGYFTAGISYDMKKCFDSIPVNLVLQVFNFRGADSKIFKALAGFYKHHEKYFRLEGTYTKAFRPSNGIVRGCPLSMLLLTRSVTTWLEHVHNSSPSGSARSYADDISLWAKSTNKSELCRTIRSMHDSTASFISSCGMTINHSKCFTFGHKCVVDSIPAIQSHRSQFRLVGGSIKLDNKSSWTKLEEERVNKWKSTVCNIRALPTGWFTKVKILKATSTQVTWGQGTHKMLSLRGLRACVVRTLLNETFYDASPGIIFSILAPPSIDPDFSLHLSAFMLVNRLYADSAARAKLCATLTSPPAAYEPDGPIARMRQLDNHPVFKNTMHTFLNGHLHERQGQHNLREDYRQHTWSTIARDRSQHFAGISQGVNRSLTISLIHQWSKEADKLQRTCDTQQTSFPDPLNDPRPRLKILCMLISGGLQTPERDPRHRRKTGQITCACQNGSPSLLHISWFCSLYQAERKPAPR